MKKLTYALTSIWMASPLAALAAEVGNEPVPCTDFSCKVTAKGTLQAIINWIFGISALIAVLFIIIGGVLFVTSAGNTDRTGKAKQTLLYAVIGLLVIILSYVIVTLVINVSGYFS